jgi:hypothetical protein
MNLEGESKVLFPGSTVNHISDSFTVAVLPTPEKLFDQINQKIGPLAKKLDPS